MPGELTECRRLAALTKPQLIDEVISLQELVNGADHTVAKYWRRVQEVEREMHARELHHFEEEQKSAELAAVIERVRAMLPGPRTFAESLSRDFAGNLWPRTIDADAVASILNTAPADALRQVKAEAWSEGWAAAGVWQIAAPGTPYPWNPYQKEKTDGQ